MLLKLLLIINCFRNSNLDTFYRHLKHETFMSYEKSNYTKSNAMTGENTKYLKH